MACLIDYGRHWDVEVVEDRLIVASNKVRGWSDRNEITALLRFSELFGDEIGHQAKTYSDPRASHPRSQVAVGGQRLKRRSAAWTRADRVSTVSSSSTETASWRMIGPWSYSSSTKCTVAPVTFTPLAKTAS